MKNDQHINECIKAWALAVREADDNAELLIENWDGNVELCSRRMKDIELKESDMLGVAVNVAVIPPPLYRYIKARDNQACPACKYGSWYNDVHEECSKKQEEFFTAYYHLIQYGVDLELI